MDLTVCLRLPSTVAIDIVRALADRHDQFYPPLTTFDGQPTSMLVPPSDPERGSAHYMYFPPGFRQRTHYHPSVRYVILVPADALDVGAAPPSLMGPHEPVLAITHIAPGEVATLRIAPYEWHRFGVATEATMGAVAFTVHGDDHVDAEHASSDLMEEVTIFWTPSDNGHVPE